MWTVYYRIPPQQAPELLRFPVPVLDQAQIPPRVLRVEAQALLLNSEILQRRILSTSSHRDPASTSPRMEWIWKQGQGLVLHRYTLNAYGETDGAVDSQVLIGPKWKGLQHSELETSSAEQAAPATHRQSPRSLCRPRCSRRQQPAGC